MRRRDDESYRLFATSRSPALYRSACLMTSGDTRLAEDLVQETLSRMYTIRGRKRCIDNPDAYAMTVLVRAYLAHRRRRSSGEQQELAIEVADRGRGGGTGTDTGFGLVGMRERVALLRGRFTAGPRPEGGFLVAARLPVPVPVTAETGERTAAGAA
ncbi:sigma factor [Streptomyces johnsoniae]|uniref:histidine kinase n=1 Tax=Streptomyces johnsoniae TaxID=3075532 RepID=A0ABU2S270_9ACTN|nr:sigma factor [Streptomyces sp. DSM 41886]MDT0443093.1 sigma factor [Streptomyces sp. DSM 41886]